MNNKISDNAVFLLNMMLHSIIILIIVSGFYFFYVVNLSSNALKTQLENIINEGTEKKIDETNLNRYRRFIKKDRLDELLNKYNRENLSDKYVINNYYLSRATAAAIFFFMLTFFLIIVSVKSNCKKDMRLSHIFKENAIVFFFIGIIEIGFFMTIAKNYIPIKPSLLSESIKESVLKNLKDE
jgi:fumarate reductase subunit C